MGPISLLTRLLRLLGVSRVVAIAVALYLWRKQRRRAAAVDVTARADPSV